MALQELKNNKLRTFLSLFGITIGIFCIIGVLATVESLEGKVQNDIKTLGNNTVYIDKWDYGGGADYPWWKFIKRPYPKYQEMDAIKSKASLAEYVCFSISGNATLEHSDVVLSNVSGHGVSEDFNSILTINIAFGRYITASEFSHGSSMAVIGYTNAENLFGSPERAVGQFVKYKDRLLQVAGVIKKQGTSFIGGGWEFDECIIMPYKVMAGMFSDDDSNPKIMVKGKENISSAGLLDELKGIMRSLHRLSPDRSMILH